MNFFKELKRRNVFRVGIAYAVASWLLLQLSDILVPLLNLPESAQRFVLLLLIIGFVPALIFAWAFEMTPEGLKREKDVDREQSISSQTGRKLDRAIILILASAVMFLMYMQMVPDTETSGSSSPIPGVTQEIDDTAAAILDPIPVSTDDKSIAVLPLVNRSVKSEDAFFAEGLHDELLTQLSRVSALRVISRTSVMGYAGTTKRMPEIGRELGVATLLEGGVQRSGDRVRINVQLIDAASDEHLWAEVYDRELTADNLFDIQSNITHAIADALQAVLTGEEEQKLEEKSTRNVDAYAYYLRGKVASKGYGRHTTDIDKSIAFFQAAIDLDPEFAAAYAELAIDWTERFWTGDRLGEDLKHAHDALEHAKMLAPELPETLTAEGYYHYWGHLDYAPAITSFNRALKREPGNYLALRGKAYALRRQGKFDEAIEALRTVVSLDPLYAEIHADLAYTLMHTGHYEQATAMINRATALGADNPFYQYNIAESYLLRGELERSWHSIAAASAGVNDKQGFYLDIQLLIARAQANEARIDHVLDSYLSWDAQSLGPDFSRGLVYIYRNEQDKLDTLIEDLQIRMHTVGREQPDAELTLLGKIQLQGLKKDQVKLSEAIKAYHAGVNPDALRIIENRAIPIAYAIAGDSEALMAYLDDMVEQFGPWEFYYFAIDPIFDNMRDLPRFQAHDQQYRQWLQQLP